MKSWVKFYHFLRSSRSALLSLIVMALTVVMGSVYCHSKRIVVPGTFALYIEGKGGPSLVSMDGCRPSYDVNAPFFSVGGLQGALLKYSPHSRQKLTCSHGNQIFFSSSEKSPSFEAVPVIRGGYVGEHLAELIAAQKRGQAPVLSLIQDEDLEEYLVMIGKNGAVQVCSLESLLKRPLVSFEGGYGVEVGIPPEIGEGAIRLKVWPTVAHLPPLDKEEENIPSIHVCFSEGERSEVLSLTYDPAASSLLWPLFDGRYWVRYQPMESVSGCLTGILVCGGVFFVSLGSVLIRFRRWG